MDGWNSHDESSSVFVSFDASYSFHKGYKTQSVLFKNGLINRKAIFLQLTQLSEYNFPKYNSILFQLIMF